MTLANTRQIYDERACEPMTISAATAHQLVSAGSPATQMPVKGQSRQIYDEKASEPIKSRADILRISAYLISNERWRDNMLFVVGINVALRVSDLITLQFCDFFDEDWNWRESFKLIEKKTRKKRKNRAITINAAVREAIELYMLHSPDVQWDDFLFRSEAYNTSATGHLNRKTVYEIITKVVADLGIPCKAGTHTLRKTFGYQLMAQADNDHKVDTLLLLQEILGHSDLRITRRYIGITTEDVASAYNGLNLGIRCEAEQLAATDERGCNLGLSETPAWTPVVVTTHSTDKTEPELLRRYN